MTVTSLDGMDSERTMSCRECSRATFCHIPWRHVQTQKVSMCLLCKPQPNIPVPILHPNPNPTPNPLRAKTEANDFSKTQPGVIVLTNLDEKAVVAAWFLTIFCCC